MRVRFDGTQVQNEEFARTSGEMLLAATSPLVMAAALIPGHRQARFASLRLAVSADDLDAGHRSEVGSDLCELTLVKVRTNACCVFLS